MKYFILAAICLGILATGAYAMIETLSLEDLAARSEFIVSVRVVGIEKVARTAQNNALYADVPEELVLMSNQFEVSASHKGALVHGDGLIVETWAGFEDSPVMVPGGSYLLFLVKSENGYMVVNGPQGCWPIEADGSFSGMGLDISLDQLKSAISK